MSNPCPYGEACYRKNPQHFIEYSHPSRDSNSNNSNSSNNNSNVVDLTQSPPRKKSRLDVEEQLQQQQQEKKKSVFLPFRLNTLKHVPSQANNDTLSIQNIIQGNIERAILFNYMFDLNWLVGECPLLKRLPELIILHGDGRNLQYEAKALNVQNMKSFQPKLPVSYGTHHSKGMLLFYPNGLRVVICTANYISQDWNNKTQGIWTQDFPKKNQDSPKNSDFGTELINYFKACGGFDSNILSEYDFSKSIVALVSSVPGYHYGNSKEKFGHLRVRKLLSEEDIPIEFEKSPTVFQFSSLGSLSENWLVKELVESFQSGKSFKRNQKNPIKIVYPTIENVRNCLEGYSGGSSLPVPKKNLKDFLKKIHGEETMCSWDGGNSVDGVGGAIKRERAIPHIKSYTRYIANTNSNSSSSSSSSNSSRIENDLIKIPWFLLTSANLSKAAWGELQKNESYLFIRSYELGVLFLPSLMKNIEATNFTCTPQFPLYQLSPKNQFDKILFFSTSSSNCSSQEDQTSKELNIFFPIPYSLPPKPYTNNCSPWHVDGPFLVPDIYGEVYDGR